MGQDTRATGAHICPMRRRVRRLSLLAMWGVGAGTAAAQQPESPPPASPPSRFSAAKALPDKVYEDRVINGLTPSIQDDDTIAQPDYNTEGWSRQLRFETRLGQNTFNNERQHRSVGVAIYGLIETPNHGVVSIDGQLASNPSGSTLTLRQRGLPLDGGWFANNEIGVVGSLAPALNQSASRVYVPTYLLQGISTEWLNPAEGLQLQASSGQPGRLDGSVVGRFEGFSGLVNSAGLQMNASPWSFAARVADARRLALTSDPALTGGLLDASSVQLSVRRQIGAQSLQANMVSTSSSSSARTQNGVWADGETQDGPLGYSAGFFWLDPGLSWAGQPMASDAAGGYVRSSWQTRQWFAEGGFDLLRSVSNPQRTGIFATGSGRWRYSRSVSVGAGASVRSFNGNAWSTYSELRWQNDWGSSGLRLDLTSQTQQRTRQLTLDHDWRAATSWSLATSLSAGQTYFGSQREILWGTALSLSAPLASDVTVRGNVTLEQTGSGNSRTGINAGLSWRVTPRWSLDGNYNLNRGRARLSTTIDPLAPPLPFASSTTQSSSIFVALRWEDRAGSRTAPLGGQALQGGGRIEGVVFLDANRNGRQEADETGTAGVTVYLDNRYAARTDSQGGFEFAFVAAGPHTITLLRETLPLPWIPTQDKPMPVEVTMRDQLRLSIGAVRSSD